MKSTVLSCAAALAVLLAAPAAQAAAWTAPAQVRIVQPGTSDPSGRVYNSIQGALGSINDASPTKRYLVKVMPGTWTVPANTTLAMKPYVDVEGSGQENTVITGSSVNAADACSAGVVTMASDMTLRNLQVVNVVPTLNGAMVHANAVVFDGIKWVTPTIPAVKGARLQDVKVVVGSKTVAGGRNNGVFGCGDDAEVTLDHVDIEARNMSDGQSNPVMMGNSIDHSPGQNFPGKLSIRNSKLTGINMGSGKARGINDDNIVPAVVDVVDTAITVEGANANAIFAGSNTITVRNSTVTFIKPTTSCTTIWATGTITISNTQFTVTGSDPSRCTYGLGGVPTANFVHSQLPGDRSNLLPARLIGNYDENFVIIPDQQ